MLDQEMMNILSEAKAAGWVMEPEAKRLLKLAGMDVTRFSFTSDIKVASDFARHIGYPVVAKVVSPKVVHKSDVGGVVAGITNDEQLASAFNRLSGIEGATGVIVEEMIKGMELITGAKLDDQFGPIVLLGAGGTAVEIYKDVALRMAPLGERDVESMLQSLKARPLFEGYRGAEPINEKALTAMLLGFSALLMDLGDRIESIDLNPVICSAARCVVADARIILK
jgi:acetate---CoA ligase (ADP-forming) subunit beta